MPIEQTQENGSGQVIDDIGEIVAGQDRELITAPIDDLCNFFGLGTRVIVALHKLKIETGLDMVRLNINKVHLYAGEVTGRRISLLKEWCELKMPRLGDALVPSQDKQSNAATSCGR